jgi:hypothetical protein
VVEILLAAGGVDTGGLKVAERIGTDPYVAPRRRNRQGADSFKRV